MRTTNDMGVFISELRKRKGLTQKQLAAQLNVTDKAISKWERGGGYPDISILPHLSNALDVSIHELLQGEMNEQNETNNEKVIKQTLDYVKKSSGEQRKKLQRIVAIIFVSVAVIACLISLSVEYLIASTFSWSLIVILSIVFGVLIILPLIFAEQKRIKHVLLSLTFSLLPFLFVLDRLENSERLWFVPLALPISVLSLVAVWSCYFLFSSGKYNRWKATSLLLIMFVPFNLAVNFFVATYTSEPLITIYDAFECIGFVVVAVILYFVSKRIQKSQM